jgi:capsular exopolysaccharide synthesis family protein
VQHEIFELDNERGLSTAFIDDHIAIDKLLKPVTADSLSVLPSGPIPHNPSELLDSPRMMEILGELKERADIVIVDSPPMLSVADATIMAPRVDGVLLVVDSGYTRRSNAKRSKELLQSIGANLVGVVVNRATVRAEADYYDYDYSPDKKKQSRKVAESTPKKARAKALPAPGTTSSNGNSALKPVRLSRPGGSASSEGNTTNGKGGTTERSN